VGAREARRRGDNIVEMREGVMGEAVGTTDKADYFSKAKRFDEDLVANGRRAVRVAQLTALAAVGVAVLEAGALMALLPLKTVEPFVIRVDNSTGIVDVVSALTGPQTYDDQVKRYFAAKYVQGREGFVASEAEPTFKTVTLMSAAAEQQRFVDGYRGSNPQSPQVVFKGATSRVAVRSISMLSKNVVAVRYLRTVTRGEEVKTTHWIATLTINFSGEAMSSGDRLINPLGFQVVDYRADPEAQ
jgi:type IV secretion system protein VirB8